MTLRELILKSNTYLNKNKTGILARDNADDNTGKYYLRQAEKLIRKGYELDDEVQGGKTNGK